MEGDTLEQDFHKSLKFDKMEYDTTLAKDFLSKHQKFVGFNCLSGSDSEVNSIGKEILLSIPRDSRKFVEDVEVKKRKLQKLAQIIIENTELFCQLEYMIRKIKPDELRAFDLKVLTQNLLFCSSVEYQPLYDLDTLYMKNHSPLARLAGIAHNILKMDGTYDIVSEIDTAVICWLFVHLCEKAGFENISLSFVRTAHHYRPEYQLDFYEYDRGCIVLVSGKADVDSAVDVLVEAHSRGPWGVGRVFVQENALERFTKTLKWKERLCPGEVDAALELRSTSAIAVGDKVFLIEYAGDAPGKAIVVHAYRTVNELLYLLKKLRPIALSIWCDSILESNEIVLNATASILWLNTYGVLDGPPRVSQSLLSEIKSRRNISISDDFKRARRGWEKLTTAERAAKLGDLIKEHNVDTDDSFYCVSDRFTCAGTERAAGTLSLYWLTDLNIAQLLAYILRGGSVVFHDSDRLVDLCEALKRAGAPVEIVDKSKTDECEVYDNLTYNYKFIWTSYGTMFAN